MIKNEKDIVYMNIAKEVAKMSKCVSVKVGAVIVKDGRIISIGYNGTPAGGINCNELWSERCKEHSEWSDKFEIHAELNAILFAAKNGISINGGKIYCTIQPCWQCTKNIIQAGITEIIYDEDYYRLEDVDELRVFLRDSNVGYRKLNTEG